MNNFCLWRKKSLRKSSISLSPSLQPWPAPSACRAVNKNKKSQPRARLHILPPGCDFIDLYLELALNQLSYKFSIQRLPDFVLDHKTKLTAIIAIPLININKESISYFFNILLPIIAKPPVATKQIKNKLIVLPVGSSFVKKGKKVPKTPDPHIVLLKS